MSLLPKGTQYVRLTHWLALTEKEKVDGKGEVTCEINGRVEKGLCKEKVRKGNISVSLNKIENNLEVSEMG